MGDDEAVARLHCVYEIDVVLEDIGERHGEAISSASLVDREIERTVDGARQPLLLGLERVLDDIGGKSLLCARDRKGRCLVDPAGERLQLAAEVGHLDHVTGADDIEAPADVGQVAKRRQVRDIQPQFAEDAVERVIAADRDGDEFERRCGCRRRACIGRVGRKFPLQRLRHRVLQL